MCYSQQTASTFVCVQQSGRLNQHIHIQPWAAAQLSGLVWLLSPYVWQYKSNTNVYLNLLLLLLCYYYCSLHWEARVQLLFLSLGKDKGAVCKVRRCLCLHKPLAAEFPWPHTPPDCFHTEPAKPDRRTLHRGLGGLSMSPYVFFVTRRDTWLTRITPVCWMWAFLV